MTTEHPSFVRTYRPHLPRLIADAVQWREKREDLTWQMYSTLDRNLAKFGTEKGINVKVGGLDGIHAGRLQKYAILETRKLEYERETSRLVVPAAGEVWAKHSVDEREKQSIIVQYKDMTQYEEFSNGPILDILTLPRDGIALGPDGKPYETEEDYAKVKELVRDLESRWTNIYEEIDPESRPSPSYPARVIRVAGYGAFPGSMSYEPLIQ